MAVDVEERGLELGAATYITEIGLSTWNSHLEHPHAHSAEIMAEVLKFAQSFNWGNGDFSSLNVRFLEPVYGQLLLQAERHSREEVDNVIPENLSLYAQLLLPNNEVIIIKGCELPLGEGLQQNITGNFLLRKILSLDSIRYEESLAEAPLAASPELLSALNESLANYSSTMIDAVNTIAYFWAEEKLPKGEGNLENPVFVLMGIDNFAQIDFSQFEGVSSLKLKLTRGQKIETDNGFVHPIAVYVEGIFENGQNVSFPLGVFNYFEFKKS